MSNRHHLSLFIFSVLSVSFTENPRFSTEKTIEAKSSEASHQFTRIEESESSIGFENRIEETPALNVINYAYVYNGAGVATADFNKDGLVDVFFLANQGSNRLYLNEGDFRFKDMTEGSGLSDAEGWSMGVSVIDINHDRWPDLYICKAGSLQDPELRQNRLYINQKDNTFRESAEEWRVNDAGFGTQSYFLDFDKDGDLDLYLVNHRPDFHNTGNLDPQVEKSFSPFTSDKLYRNEGKFFTEITHAANLVNKAWGLSAAIGDFNNDDWPDIYVCNDFLAPDMLYINKRDGTFFDESLTRLNHISFNSMGSDYADINNDGLPDLVVLEMAAEDHVRSKSNMATMNTRQFHDLVKMGYHHQYMVNTLQLNTAKGQFSEIGQLSGIAKTDWSWAPLVADFDNDGWKDLLVTNGILRELANQDAARRMSTIAQKRPLHFKDVLNLLPSTKLANYAFRNNGDLTFTNVSLDWGLDEKTHSNGAAYADFDNDGDLDLVINNLNGKAGLYRNNDTNRFIQIRLKGGGKNTLGLGAKVTISAEGRQQYQEMYLSRGYLSSVQNVLHFGVGKAGKVDEIKVEWDSGQITRLEDIPANRIISIDEDNARARAPEEKQAAEKETHLTQINLVDKGVTYRHKENAFDDYRNQILLPHSQSHNGPFLDTADVNKDGLEDFFVGGAAGQSGELYLQTTGGNFEKQPTIPWEEDKAHEDLGVLFLDADADGDPDLYVVSGGSEFPEESEFFQDRLYVNDGKGNFHKSADALPEIRSSGQCVKASDIDGDGDLDLFVGGRTIPDRYPYPPESYLLVNEDGKFLDRTAEVAPALGEIGMVTDAIFSDYDNDGDEDLFLVGEWMAITLFDNVDGELHPKEIGSLAETEGIWFSIAGCDIDDDGDIDYFAGNLGLNTKFKASAEKPFYVFADDFDDSGTYDIVLTANYEGTLVPSRGRECSAQQMPFIERKFPDFQSFAEATLKDIFGEEELENALSRRARKLESVFLENTGNGEFEIRKLPNAVQISPVMDFGFIDLDHDGRAEVMVVGNHYETEVETVRYDASYGSVLSFINGEFREIDVDASGFLHKGNAKDLGFIKTKEGTFVLITNNDDTLRGYRVGKPKPGNQ